MSQNITLLGASYTDVPSVQLPKTGGGLASFDDTTDANAVASDILTGKTAYVNGVKLTGTGSGGSATTRYITLFDNSAEITSDNPNYIWINNQPEAIGVGDRYRVTWNNVAYTVTATNDPTIGSQYGNTFGNASILGGATDPSNAPFCAFKSSWSDNEMIVSTTASGTVSLKIEKIVYGDNLTLQTKTITQNGTYTADSGYDALESVIVNVSGGSGARIETGTFKLTSDFTLTTSAQKITGLQLSFKPDYFMFTPDRASFEARASYSSGLWELVAFKKSLFPPYASSSSLSPEAVTTNDYGFFYRQAVTQNTSISCGYGVGGMSFLSQSYYSRYSVNDDGTISVGRYSSSSTRIWAGTYKYIAIKF